MTYLLNVLAAELLAELTSCAHDALRHGRAEDANHILESISRIERAHVERSLRVLGLRQLAEGVGAGRGTDSGTE